MAIKVSAPNQSVDTSTGAILSSGEPSTIGLTLIVSAIILANVVLKTSTISTDGIWLDEALSLHVAQAPVSIQTLAAHEPTPPLYYFFLCGWTRVVGSSLETARLLSVVLSTATALVIFDIGRRHFNASTGVVAAALFTVSKLQLYYAQEARCYALVGLLCVVSFDLFLALVFRPNWLKAVALGFVNAAIMYSHYVAVFALVSQLVAALLIARRQGQPLSYYVGSQVLAALLFAPWLVGVVRDGIAQNDWIGPPTLDRARYVVKRFAGSSTLLVLYLVTAAVATIARRYRPAANVDWTRCLVLVLWAIAPIALAYWMSFFRQVLVDRYVLYASLGMYLLVAYIVSLVPQRTLRTTSGCVLIGIALFGAVGSPHRRHDWRQVTELVRAEHRAGSKIIVAPAYHFRPLAFYLDPVAFNDYEQTRERLEAMGITFLDDLQSPMLGAARSVLVLAPEVTPPVAEILWQLEDRGFVVVRQEYFHGLSVYIIEQRAGSSS